MKLTDTECDLVIIDLSKLTDTECDLVIIDLSKASLLVQQAYQRALKAGDGAYAGELRAIGTSIGAVISMINLGRRGKLVVS